MTIAWTRVHLINTPYVMQFASNAREASTCPAFKKIKRDIIPHREKRGVWRVYMVGRRKANGLMPQSYNEGPLTRGPFTHQPLICHVAPPWRPRGPAWPCHASASHSRHLSAAGACTTLPRGLVCRVAFAQAPRATSALRATLPPWSSGNKPLFAF